MEKENRILHLDFEVSLDQYRRIWFDYFKQSLPNAIAFWGTIIILLAFAAFVFRNNARDFVIFAGLLGVVLLTAIYTIYANYRGFMSQAKKIFYSLQESHKSVSLIFNSESDGFESINGKNFSHTSYDSIKKVEEKDVYFIFQMKVGTMFYIPKTAFDSDEKINFFRSLLKQNVENKINIK